MSLTAEKAQTDTTTEPWVIEVASGRMIDLTTLTLGLALGPEAAVQIKLADIAHGLSNLCRFNGHCRRFYSVAQHSVVVAEIAEWMGGNIETQRWGLLHDAHEAYLGDMIRPLKADVVAASDRFRRIADGIDTVVQCKFVDDLQWEVGDMAVDRELVRFADMVALYAEKRDVMGEVEWPGFSQRALDGASNAVGRIRPLAPGRARRLFMRKARRLGVVRLAGQCDG